VIIDAFLYSGENDLLEIRLHELKDTIDWFVIVESLETFTGNSRESIIDWTYIESFRPRIKHVVLPQLFPPFTSDDGNMSVWARERWSFEQLLVATLEIPGVTDDDTLIIGCVDEIPRSSAIKQCSLSFLEMDMFWYQVSNYVGKWKHPRIGFVREFQEFGVDGVRHMPDLPVIPNAGWHFSSFGGPEMVRQKLRSFSHASMERYQECVQMTDSELVAEFAAGGDFLRRELPEHEHRASDDLRLPAYFLQNRSRFAHFTEEYWKELCLS